MFRNDTLLVMISLSLICILFLIGLYFYHGSFLPSLKGASSGKRLEILAIWGTSVAIPSLTLGLLLLKFLRKPGH